MLFSKRNNGYFVELNNHTVWVARTSTADGSAVVDEIRSCEADKPELLAEVLQTMQPKRRGQHSYVHASCGIYPPSRVVRHAALDPKRYKDTAYVNEVLTNQLRIDGDRYTLALLDAGNGLDFDFNNPARKDSLFAGMFSDDILAYQNRLLGWGLYPERLELSTMATLGALVDYHSFAQIKTPTLLLEIDRDSTQSFILAGSGVEASRPIPQGLEAMVPVVQKEIGLKDEEAARKLFYSNAFDFTGMGATLIKKLVKELQSSIGFYEVQTGQSINQVVCTLLPPKLSWLQNAISTQLGVPALTIDFEPWLQARGIKIAPTVNKELINNQTFGLFSLMLSHHHAVDTQKEA
jgi:hypothetical protein